MLRCEALSPKNPRAILDEYAAAVGAAKGGQEGEEGSPLYIFDTETTGISKKDCIVEIGCVEMRDGRLTGRNFHRMCRPYAPMHPKAAEVHGITADMLKDEMSVSEALVDFYHYLIDGTAAEKKALATAQKEGAGEGANASQPPQSFTIEGVEQLMANFSIATVHKAQWGAKLSASGSLSAESPSSLSATARTAASENASPAVASPAAAAPAFESDASVPPSPASAPSSSAPAPLRIAFCGHNVAFDMRMLTDNAAHCGLDALLEDAADSAPLRPLKGSSGRPLTAPFTPATCPSLCTMRLFKQLFPGQSTNTLDACCDFFGIERNLSAAERAVIGDFRLKSSAGQHSALTDAYATGLLLEKMLATARTAAGTNNTE